MLVLSSNNLSYYHIFFILLLVIKIYYKNLCHAIQNLCGSVFYEKFVGVLSLILEIHIVSDLQEKKMCIALCLFDF